MEEHIEGGTFNVCYLREYMDPEQEGEFFYAYETVYRNVPRKFKHIFTDKVKLKIVKLKNLTKSKSSKELNLRILFVITLFLAWAINLIYRC